MTADKTDHPPTASDLYLVRLMNENARLARQVANLREDLRKKAVEADSAAATIAGLRDGVQKLTDRLNTHDRRRDAVVTDWQREFETVSAKLDDWRSWANGITGISKTAGDEAMRASVAKDFSDRVACLNISFEKSTTDALRLADEIAALKRKHAEDDRALVGAHARELREAKEAHAKEVADLRAAASYGGRLSDSMAETAEWRDAFKALEDDVCEVLRAADLGHLIRPGDICRLGYRNEWRVPLIDKVKSTTADLVPAHQPSNPDESYRGNILRECAHDCTIYVGPGKDEMRVVVGLRDGKTLDDVAAVLERMGRAPGTYSLREVRQPGNG